MLRKSKKLLTTLLASGLILAMTLGTAGCKKAEPAAAPTGGDQKLQPVELTFSEQDDPQALDPTWQKLAEDFMAKYPEVKVKVTHTENEGQRQDWQNQVLAGAGPDILSGPPDNISLFAAAGTAMELDNFMSKEFYATLDSKVITNYKYNGKIYGIPYKVGNCLTLVYNKKLMPEAPKTMEELISKAKELTKAPNQYGLVYDMVEPFFISPFYGGFGGRFFDDKGKPSLDNEAAKKTFQLEYDWKFTNKITPQEGNTDVANGLFKEGKAAMIINGPWFYSQAKTANIDYGIAKLPLLDGGKAPVPFTDVKVFIVNPNIKDANKKLAVQKFIEFMNTKDNQLMLAKASSEVPTNIEAQKDSYVTNTPEVKALAEAMKDGIPMPNLPELRCVWDSFRNTSAKVMSGDLKPEDAPKVWQEECLKLIKEQFGKTYN